MDNRPALKIFDTGTDAVEVAMVGQEEIAVRGPHGFTTVRGPEMSANLIALQFRMMGAEIARLRRRNRRKKV